MQLVEIDAERYRKRLTKIIFASIAMLTIGSLSLSQLLIYLVPSTQGTHFHWNLTGFIITVILVSKILLRLKSHDYFYEAAYVWDLKKILNKINRRMTKIEKSAFDGDKTAMQILHYSYTGSRQLWELDNNTLTISHLTQLENKLHTLAETHQVTLDTHHFNPQKMENY